MHITMALISDFGIFNKKTNKILNITAKAAKTAKTAENMQKSTAKTNFYYSNGTGCENS